jgi:hypothetical protein
LREWLLRQWNDIKGNVKFYALGLAGSAILTTVGLLTHGLKWWQQATLLFIFGAVLVWAITATVLAVIRAKTPLVNILPVQPPETSLRDRTFIFCQELSAYASEREARPSEEELYSKYKDSGQLFAEHYDAEIQSWDDKLSAGYWLKFRDRAVNLRHDLVLQDVRDNALDDALSALERVPGKDYFHKMQTVIERFRYDASTLH